MKVDSFQGKKCLICNKYLRKLTKSEDWKKRVYHIKCWNMMIQDIKNFDKICYDKYDYEPVVEGKTIKEWRELGKGITINWD